MRRVALVGMPNTGKSTLFNRLTGAHARVGNWPGVTVDLMGAKLLLGADMVEVVDLPGIYDLRAYSEDEAVVERFFEHNRVDLVMVVVNAAQIERQLVLVEQLRARSLPLLLVLNMQDEAAALGIRIDAEALAAGLGIPVLLLSAKHGRGLERLRAALAQSLRQPHTTVSTPLSERDLDALLQRAVMIPAQASHALTERIDRLLLHPFLGLPLFLLVMLLLFQFVFTVGKPLQDALNAGFELMRSGVLEPVLAGLPDVARGFLLDGVYAGLATVASFVPLILIFFLVMALVEDTGYLTRAAFLMDALMTRLGLDGRSFVMVLMGFGCNVPALMGTRVMRTRGLRLLTMLIIPFSLCSARLQVFVFVIAAFFAADTAPYVLFGLYLLSIVAVIMTALIFRKRYANGESFVLEMPPYRLPTFRHMLLRGWQEMRHFLTRATRFIVAGVIGVWLLTHFPLDAAPGSSATWAGRIGEWLAPVLSPVGIDPQLTIALIFGFVAKEIVVGSLAVIYAQEGAALTSALTHDLTALQAMSFMIFTLLYTPCLSTLATIRQESRSLSFSLLALAWPLILAWLASWAFYRSALLLQARFWF